MLQLKEITKHEWWQAWEDGYQTTYLQSPAWFALWEKISKGSAAAWSVWDEHNTFLGVFPVFTKSSYGVQRCESSCAGTYGGLIQPQDHRASLSGSQIKELAGHFPNLTWRLSPETTPESLPDFLQADYTHRLDLTQGMETIESHWEKGKSGIARKNRKARKNGISVFPAKYPEEWKEYHELYLENTRRWDPPPNVIYPFRLLDLIRSTEKQYATLWLAVSADDNLIAGALCLYSKSNAVYWHGASSEKHSEARPMNLLLSTIIRDAAKRGLSFFDFNPSGGVKGVEKFKESFGAEKAASPIISNRTGLMQAAANFKSTVNRVRGRITGNG